MARPEKFPNEILEKFYELCEAIIADPNLKPHRAPNAKQPATRTQTRSGGGRATATTYELPKATRIVADGVMIPGSDPNTEWHVVVGAWTCDCPAFVHRPPCKHVLAVKKLMKVK